ncbi:hypothetical protein D3C81_2052780 [compost metagenome]
MENIERGQESDVGAAAAQLQRHPAAGRLHQLRIPGRTDSQIHRKQRAVQRLMAVRTLLAEQHRNAQPCMFPHITLHLVRGSGTVRSRNAIAVINAGPRVAAE